MNSTSYFQQRVSNILHEELDTLGDTVVIVFDEIDNIGRSDDILYEPPRV